MDFKAESLDCPNCGAPLNLAKGIEFTFCEYCHSSIRITKHEDTGEDTASHMDVPPEVIAEVKKLILNGSKAEAVELYMKSAGIEKDAAEKLVNAIVASITNRIILNRPLSGKGIFFAVFFFAVAGVTFWLLASHTVDTKPVQVLCWMVLIFMLINIASIFRAIITTIKFAGVKWTKATVLKFVLINTKKNLSFYKALLDVKEPNGLSFKAETNIMIKNENVYKLQEGKIIDVKYLEKDKKNIVASVQNL